MGEENKDTEQEKPTEVAATTGKDEQQPKKELAKAESVASAYSTTSDSFAELGTEIWAEVCDWVDEQGEVGSMIASNVLRRVGVDAPVMLTFVCLITVIHALDYCMMHSLSYLLAVPHYFYFFYPLSYMRLFSHILVHSSYAHLKANTVSLLLVGPNVEHAFGSQNMLIILCIVAFASAVAHILVSRTGAKQMGASAICFAMILLNSIVSASTGTVPLSFIIISILWITDEIIRLFFAFDGVSHHAHLVGAFCGTAYGYMLYREKVRKRVSRIAAKWLQDHRNKSKKA